MKPYKSYKEHISLSNNARILLFGISVLKTQY